MSPSVPPVIGLRAVLERLMATAVDRLDPDGAPVPTGHRPGLAMQSDCLSAEVRQATLDFRRACKSHPLPAEVDAAATEAQNVAHDLLNAFVSLAVRFPKFD